MVSKNMAKGLKSSKFRYLNSFNCLVVALMYAGIFKRLLLQKSEWHLLLSLYISGRICHLVFWSITPQRIILVPYKETC